MGQPASFQDVAMLGYGRFGRALAGLLVDAGVRVRASDPRADVPEEMRAATIDELVSGVDAVVVAVPVPSMRDALRALRPHLSPMQVVLDVGSVKVHPAEALAEILGAEIPWVATHPLFGPTSLALAERPLRAVVCPNELHPHAVTRVRDLFAAIGCLVLEQSAEEHDRAMAETHALAFFVAKGILDAGVGLDVPYAPPSFQAIARTVDAVRSDAGHLFAAIQRENPYSAEARERLLEALSAVHRTIATTTDEIRPVASSAALAIPEGTGASPELRETRELIDEVDRELVALLGRRAELAKRAFRAKESAGKRLLDPAREASLLAERRTLAEERGLDPESIEDIFRAILRFSRRLQGSR